MNIREAVKFINEHKSRSGAPTPLLYLQICSECGSEYAQIAADRAFAEQMGLERVFCQDTPCKAARRHWVRNRKKRGR